MLLPELPAIVARGQYSRRFRDARNYATYHDGVAYFVISFDNPNHEKPLEYFLQEQLSAQELRNANTAAGAEVSNGTLKGMQYSLRKYDYRGSLSYPGVLRLFEAENRAFALLAIGKYWNDQSVQQFLRSFELSDRPAGIDIAQGARTQNEESKAEDFPITSPSDASVKAMILIKPEPHYTAQARQKRISGEVSLKAVLSASGRVTDIQVVAGVPELTPSAIEAARKMFFIPATKDGHFVSTYIELKYHFNIF